MSEQTQQQTAALEQTIVAAREAAMECGVDLDSPRIGADGNPRYPNTSYAFELDGLEDGPQLKDIEAALEELDGVAARLVYSSKTAWITAPSTTPIADLEAVFARFGVSARLTDSTLRRRVLGRAAAARPVPRRGVRGLSGRRRKLRHDELVSLRRARAQGFVDSASRAARARENEDVLFTARDLVTPVRMWLAIVLTLPVLLLTYVSDLQFDGWQWACFALTTPVALWCAFPFHRAMAGGVRRGISALDGASSIAILAAYFWSAAVLLFTPAGELNWRNYGSWVPLTMVEEPGLFFEVACTITSLLLVGRFFSMRVRPHLQEDLSGRVPDAESTYMVRRRSRTGKVIEEPLPAAEINRGDDIVILPGAIIPADGEVVGGCGTLEQELIDAHESPTLKVGSHVYAGSVLRKGKVKIRVSRVGHATRLASVNRWLERASEHQNATTMVSTRAAGMLIPVAYVLAVLDFGLWLLFTGNLNAAFSTALAILAVVAPVALAISTALAIRLGIESAARNGILVRDGSTFRTLEATDVAVFNRVGTLVEPKMKVETVTAEIGEDPALVLGIAGALSVESDHPASRAIVKAAREARDKRDKDAGGPTWFELANEDTTPDGSVRGRVTLTYEDQRTENLDAILWRPTNLSQLQGRLSLAATAGGTPVVVRWKGRDRGVITLYDPPKADATSAIDRLESIGVETIMLTRDTYPVARRFADFLGMSRVLAGITAPDKPHAVRALHTKGATVAMVGDHSAVRTLRVADVSILYADDALLGANTGKVEEKCNVLLLRRDVTAVPQLVELARRVCRTIDSNMVIAWTYNAAAILLAIAGVLPPVGATLLMLGSSLVIELRSVRVRHFPA
ncbi:heavy metal translocating P-type ATPase [Corynebacterium hadale]|uniref:heavy metal translocating P-type ATPase n=1 Tax=Corynebacterium hadale TaxID=2026255 RepID=UPI000BAA3762|nr:HAD family hydrolase [Corynebacterium hadale]PAT08045.1 metal-transporting ATPase [Corynebacterium hadale]